MLEHGAAPWQKPWEPGAGIDVPLNPITNRSYRGGNALHLLALSALREYSDSRWMTYRQAQERGWQVRAGEKGTHVEYWEFPGQTGAEREGSAADGTTDVRPRLVHRVYTVFNAQQINGIPSCVPREHPEFEVVQAGESILKNSGARIAHDQRDQAFYDRLSDSIHMPPRSAFKSAPAFYGTASHELVHWSGHRDRLNRPTLNDSQRFGDEQYAKEELRAEIASFFLSAARGIPHDPANHAAYVAAWLRALRNDKNEVFRAAADAQVAVDFLLALERHKSVHEALEEAKPPHPRRETAEYVAQYEAGSGTVDIERKQTATERRSPAEPDLPDAADALAAPEAIAERILDDQVQGLTPKPGELKRSFAEARELGELVLGEAARVLVAQTDSGNYRGEVIGRTSQHIVQQINSQSAVAHMKHFLSRVPEPGECVRIAYSNERAEVERLQPKVRARGLER
jgi:antirestriction protein ArdC